MKENKISRSTFLHRALGGGTAALAGGAFLPGLVSENQPRSKELKLASFSIDATPPVGSQLIYERAERIKQPLSCRGVVLLTDKLPIVLVGIDWIGIGNGGYELWRFKLAQAVGTSPEMVAVHTLHQHDSVGFDMTVENLLLAYGRDFGGWASPFHYKTLERAVGALKEAMKNPVPITHVGEGSAEVRKFASTRRIWGRNGKVKHERFTSTGGHPDLRKYPAGLIDSNVRLVSFWNSDTPVAVLSYYATHPQSYYRQGGISCDTVGIARNSREQETGIFHLHFNGAGGNIGAGKYNDGSHKMRHILAGRLAKGMEKAFNATEKKPITQDQIGWLTYPVLLPAEIRVESDKGEGVRTFTERDEAELLKVFKKKINSGKSISGLGGLGWLTGGVAWMHRCIRHRQIDLSCLRLGKVAILHMPGELFVEYQLAAQKMREDLFVAMAAYGDYGPEYIGTRAAYGRGGYETGTDSRVAPNAEEVLTTGMQKLLQAKNMDITPSYFTHQKQKYS